MAFWEHQLGSLYPPDEKGDPGVERRPGAQVPSGMSAVGVRFKDRCHICPTLFFLVIISECPQPSSKDYNVKRVKIQ